VRPNGKREGGAGDFQCSKGGFASKVAKLWQVIRFSILLCPPLCAVSRLALAICTRHGSNLQPCDPKSYKRGFKPICTFLYFHDLNP
jgi:hypothetical protein